MTADEIVWGDDSFGESFTLLQPGDESQNFGAACPIFTPGQTYLFFVVPSEVEMGGYYITGCRTGYVKGPDNGFKRLVPRAVEPGMTLPDLITRADVFTTINE